MQRKEDKRLLPYMILAFVLIVGLSVAFGVAVGGFTMYLLIPLGVVLGALVAFIIFGRRAQKSVYKKAEGQTGAAAWALDNLRGKWRVTPGVAATGNFDAVHRVIGRPGVIFVGEGAPNRVKPLLAQEKKRTARLVGDVPRREALELSDDVGRGDLIDDRADLVQSESSPVLTCIERERRIDVGGVPLEVGRHVHELEPDRRLRQIQRDADLVGQRRRCRRRFFARRHGHRRACCQTWHLLRSARASHQCHGRHRDDEYTHDALHAIPLDRQPTTHDRRTNAIQPGARTPGRVPRTDRPQDAQRAHGPGSGVRPCETARWRNSANRAVGAPLPSRRPRRTPSSRSCRDRAPEDSADGPALSRAPALDPVPGPARP